MARYPSSTPIRTTARSHITWRLIRTYKALYRSPSTGDEITVRSITPPPKTRTFRSTMGRRKYIRQKATTTKREVIIVARTKTRKNQVDQEELEELEALEDAEELEDEVDDEDLDDEEEDDEDDEEEEEDEDDEEDEPEDEEDEDEEDEDEEPAPKRSRRTKKSSAKGKSRASADGMVGTQEVAEHFGTNGRALRMVLRRHNIETDPDSGRYQWTSLKHPEVVKIGKLLAKGEAKKAQRESLDNLKARKAKTSTKSTSKTPTKRTAKATPATKSTKSPAKRSGTKTAAKTRRAR